jgi:hypothetical protein
MFPATAVSETTQISVNVLKKYFIRVAPFERGFLMQDFLHRREIEQLPEVLASDG